MKKSLDISDHQLSIVQKILQNHLPEEKEVWVFGSRAEGRARRASDLDLAIDLGRPLTKTESNQLFNAFEESDLPYKVDVVDLRSINSTFKNLIDREKKQFPFKQLPRNL